MWSLTLRECWPLGQPVQWILETLIRTLTLTTAWRLLSLLAGLLFALALPGVQPHALAADSTGTITGIVVAETSAGPKPVANAEVRLTFGSKSDSRKTGADGKYTFVGLLPGKYAVRVTPPDGLKTKGDGVVSVTLDGGDTERADFGLLAPPTPTQTPAPRTATPGPTASPKPAAAKPETAVSKPVSSVAKPETAAAKPETAPSSAAAAAVQIAPPPLVAPFASPSTAPQAGTQARTAGPTMAPASLIPSGSNPVNAIGSPAPLLFGTPGMLIASSSPTPGPDPAGTETTTPIEDVLASGPPRRLITSFEALRQTAGAGAASQLKSWATESSLVLGVPFRTQIDGTTFSLVNCGPASLTMVLVAFGLDVDPASVRDYLNHLVGNFDTEQGTSLYVLARIAREAGLSTFGTSAGLQGWTVEAIREQVRAGNPVITLTKYRFLPGHFGSVTDFDHYIVITGLAGEDFVYNDAAYSTEYGYNLLISPAQLERAWAASSVPRHAVAIGFGDSLKPLPIVPRGLTAESLAVTAPLDEVNAVAPAAPIRVNRGPAAEWLREQMLDRLGARTAIVGGLPADDNLLTVPRTRLDPADIPSDRSGIEESPTGSTVTDSAAWAAGASADDGAQQIAEGTSAADTVADTSSASQASDQASFVVPTDQRAAGAPSSGETAGSLARWLSPLGLGFLGFGVMLAVVGRMTGWRRNEMLARIQQLPKRLPRPRLPRRR